MGRIEKDIDRLAKAIHGAEVDCLLAVNTATPDTLLVASSVYCERVHVMTTVLSLADRMGIDIHMAGVDGKFDNGVIFALGKGSERECEAFIWGNA